MKKEKAKELSEILKAYSEGKTIQIYIDGTIEGEGAFKGWHDIENFDLEHFSQNDFFKELSSFDYDSSFKMNGLLRIKPEPKLVPFTFEDGHLFLNKVVKGKAPFLNEKMRNLVVSCNVEFVWTGTVSVGVNYSRFLNEFEFEDGSPCGKYVE